MADFSRLNHLPMEVKELIVTGQSLIDNANNTLKDRNFVKLPSRAVE